MEHVRKRGGATVAHAKQTSNTNPNPQNEPKKQNKKQTKKT